MQGKARPVHLAVLRQPLLGAGQSHSGMTRCRPALLRAAACGCCGRAACSIARSGSSAGIGSGGCGAGGRRCSAADRVGSRVQVYARGVPLHTAWRSAAPRACSCLGSARHATFYSGRYQPQVMKPGACRQGFTRHMEHRAIACSGCASRSFKWLQRQVTRANPAGPSHLAVPRQPLPRVGQLAHRVPGRRPDLLRGRAPAALRLHAGGALITKVITGFFPCGPCAHGRARQPCAQLPVRQAALAPQAR